MPNVTIDRKSVERAHLNDRAALADQFRALAGILEERARELDAPGRIHPERFVHYAPHLSAVASTLLLRVIRQDSVLQLSVED